MTIMEYLRTNKTVAIGITVVVVATGLYFVLFRDGEEAVLESAVPAGSEQTIGRELLVTLLELRSLKLDGDIFSEPSFLNLKDFSIAIPPQPSGRRNPFAPLGSDERAPNIPTAPGR